MAKHDSPSMNLEQSWLEHPAMQWALEHKRQLGYGAAILLLLLIIAYRLLASSSSQAEYDYVRALQYASQLTNPEKRTQALTDLQGVVNRHPELHAKYDGLIIQELLLDNQLQAADPYIQRTWQRVGGETPPFYLDYAQTSILMSQNDLTTALANAYALKEKMLKSLSEKATEFGGTLYVFNLIRIGLIEKELKNKEAEKKVWSELNEISNGTHVVKLSDQDLQRVMTHFDDQSAQLKTFIN